MGSGARRSFLFLQGLATPFWVQLADEISGRGHIVNRINLCGGDRLFWRRRGALDYRGRFSGWRKFLGTTLHDWGTTDIILFGDCRPYHRIAKDLAQSRGIAVHVFEEGYFRPDWITLERSGANAFSGCCREPAAILRAATDDPTPEVPPVAVSGGFSRRVRWEMLNQAATLLLAPLYPHYRRHRLPHPLREMVGWARRIARRPRERRYVEDLSQALWAGGQPYYLLPLQLDTDYQIRRHSHFASMVDVIDTVLESFARNAPPAAALVVKIHPLDNGLVDFRRHAERAAEDLRIADRVFVVDGGHLPTLLSKSSGVVIVNSTTGLSALHHNRPVKTLGQALFDMPGLTFQGPLDAFWTGGSPPDQALFRAFRRVLLTRAQVNGSFFTEAGIALALDNVLTRMEVAVLTPAIAGHPLGVTPRLPATGSVPAVR
jgi:capsular polysaccharide export protein